MLGNADHAAGYHAVNLALHVANTSLVAAIALRLFRRPWTAALVAALWGVHPLTTEAVTNLVGRADLLAGLGVLTAFYCHLRLRELEPLSVVRGVPLQANSQTAETGLHRRPKDAVVGGTRTRWLAGIAIGSAVAAWSKEHGVAVVGVLVLFDLVVRDRPLPARFAAWIAAGVPVAAFLLQRSMVLSGISPAPVLFVDNPIAGSPFIAGRLTALAVMGRYLWLSLWPASLSADYSFSQIALARGSAFEWAAWIAVVAVSVLANRLLLQRRVSGAMLAIAFILLLPVSNLLFAAGTVMAERFMYLPLAFLILAAVPAAIAVASSERARLAVTIGLAALLPILTVRTLARNADWNTELSLWTATVESAPLSFKSHGSFAEALYQSDPSRSNFARVLAEKEESLRLLELSPRPEEVTRPYREAAIYYLDYGDWLKARGGSAADVTKAFERAAALAEKFLTLEGNRPGTEADRQQARLVLSTVYERLARGDQALAAAQRAQAAAPLDPMSYRTMAAALLTERRADEAAVTLMTGFMLTGNVDLRSGLIDLYRGGLDPNGCALRPDGTSLNAECAPVRRHVCAAAQAASEIHRAAGRPQLAEQALASVRGTCQ